MSALLPNLLQNYFEGVASATLIQDQTKTSNIDSPQRPIGFDYCAIAMRQRVLQHIRGQSGRDRLRESAFAVVIRGAADMASCSAYVGF